jgi:hypothetical protein
VQRGRPFGRSVQRQAGVNQQTVAVLHQPMPDEAQLRLLAYTLTVKPILDRWSNRGDSGYRSQILHFGPS